MTGVSKDFYDMNKIMKNVLDEDEIDGMEEPTKEVHQFSYRSTAGGIFNIMFFFNAGSLTASTALWQLSLVIHCCEMVGSRVFGLVCDAAGSMQRLYRYLRKKEVLPEEAWLSADLVRFRNPYDTSRWIYLFHCATHNLKNTRGQFWESKPNGLKLFYHAEQNIISKSICKDAWLRDEERALSNNALQMTDLRKGSIELDKWNKMSAKAAKDPFTIRTQLELVQEICIQFGVSHDDIYQVKDHPTRFRGYFTTVVKKMKQILKENYPNSKILASMIASFELGAHISELYNQLLLNMKQMISWKNIDELEAQVKKSLEYFSALRKAQLDRKATNLEGWEKTMIAKETYDILRLSFRGFFGYCRYLIELAANSPANLLPRPLNVKQKFAITPAHATSSFIEAWFLLMQLMGFDEAIKYCSGVANRQMAQGIKRALANNPSYDAEDVGEIQDENLQMDPRELVKFLHAKRAFRDATIAIYLDMKQKQSDSNSAWVDAFGSDLAEGEISASHAVDLLKSLLEDESRTPTSTTVISDGEISSRSSDIDTNDVSMYVNVSDTSLASASSSKDDSSEDIGMICDADISSEDVDMISDADTRKRAANPSSSDLSPKKKQARDVVSKRDDVHNPYRNLQ